MSRIRGKDTTPEIKLRKKLHTLGYRYRVNVRKLPGSPDIVLAKYRTCIFVNGCFWHGHKDCRYSTRPKTNAEFWRTKIGNNRERDLRDNTFLESLGWRVVVVWECELKKDRIDSTIATVREQLDANRESWLKEKEDRKAARLQRIEETRNRKDRQSHLLDEIEKYFGPAIRKQMCCTEDSEGLSCIEMIEEPEPSSEDRKKQEENKSVLRVLKFMRIQDFSIVIQESPDILVRCSVGKNVGAEVTECCPSKIDNVGNAHKASNLKNHIIDRYKKLLLERGEEHSIVCIRFKSKIYGPLSGQDKRIIENAVKEIDLYRRNEHILNDLERFNKGTEAFIKCSELLSNNNNLNYNYIDKVTVTESEDFMTNVYEDFDVRFSRDIMLHHLQDTINAKEIKLQEYKLNPKNKEINEYWLVIQIPSIEAYDLNENCDYSGLTTSFDKLFVNGFHQTIQIK